MICNAQRRVSTRPSRAPASSRHVECTCSLIPIIPMPPGAARPQRRPGPCTPTSPPCPHGLRFPFYFHTHQPTSPPRHYLGTLSTMVCACPWNAPLLLLLRWAGLSFRPPPTKAALFRQAYHSSRLSLRPISLTYISLRPTASNLLPAANHLPPLTRPPDESGRARLPLCLLHR